MSWVGRASMPERQQSERAEVVARCLAQLDGRFIGASDWRGDRGDEYREKARRVLRTLANYDAGMRSGGLPS